MLSYNIPMQLIKYCHGAACWAQHAAVINNYTGLQSVKSRHMHFDPSVQHPIKRMLTLNMKDNENNTVAQHKAGTRDRTHSTTFEDQKGCYLPYYCTQNSKR